MHATTFPLTAPQIDIYVDQMMHRGRPIYNTGQTLVFDVPWDGELKRELFFAALERVVHENDALRVRISRDGARLQQTVAGRIDVERRFADFSAEPAAGICRLEQEFWNALQPSDFPLFQFLLMELDRSPQRRRFVWLQKYHHLVVDAASRQMVAARVAEIYDSLCRGVEPPPAGAGSYQLACELEASYLQSDAYHADAGYWRGRLAGNPDQIFAGSGAASARRTSGRPQRLACRLSLRESGGLRELARAHRATPFKLLVCIAWACVRKLYGKEDLVFGVAIANRPPEAKRVVGLFSKVMPFRPRLRGDMDLAAALQAVDRDLAADLGHQRYPASHLDRALPPGQKRPRHEIAINYVRTSYDFRLGGSPVTCDNLSAAFVEPWRIMALDYYEDRPLEIVIDYDDGLIPAPEAGRLFGALDATWRAAARGGASSLRDLALVPALAPA
jgi:nonribosomal peptide synthetase DhbF